MSITGLCKDVKKLKMKKNGKYIIAHTIDVTSGTFQIARPPVTTVPTAIDFFLLLPLTSTRLPLHFASS
jgi:hypothetical protein